MFKLSISPSSWIETEIVEGAVVISELLFRLVVSEVELLVWVVSSDRWERLVGTWYWLDAGMLVDEREGVDAVEFEYNVGRIDIVKFFLVWEDCRLDDETGGGGERLLRRGMDCESSKERPDWGGGESRWGACDNPDWEGIDWVVGTRDNPDWEGIDWVEGTSDNPDWEGIDWVVGTRDNPDWEGIGWVVGTRDNPDWEGIDWVVGTSDNPDWEGIDWVVGTRDNPDWDWWTGGDSWFETRDKPDDWGGGELRFGTRDKPEVWEGSRFSLGGETTSELDWEERIRPAWDDECIDTVREGGDIPEVIVLWVWKRSSEETSANPEFPPDINVEDCNEVEWYVGAITTSLCTFPSELTKANPEFTPWIVEWDEEEVIFFDSFLLFFLST